MAATKFSGLHDFNERNSLIPSYKRVNTDFLAIGLRVVSTSSVGQLHQRPILVFEPIVVAQISQYICLTKTEFTSFLCAAWTEIYKCAVSWIKLVLFTVAIVVGWAVVVYADFNGKNFVSSHDRLVIWRTDGTRESERFPGE